MFPVEEPQRLGYPSRCAAGREAIRHLERERERHFSESERVKAIKQESKKSSNLVKSWNSDCGMRA